jgi:hypothetical protein
LPDRRSIERKEKLNAGAGVERRQKSVDNAMDMVERENMEQPV